MTKTLSLLTATLAALAIAATPALAGENDDDDESDGGGSAPVTQVAPQGGVATGLGGTADDGSGSALLLISGLTLTGAGGVLALKRRAR